MKSVTAEPTHSEPTHSEPSHYEPTHCVVVDVASVWSSPEAPRAIDAPALHDHPDSSSWLAAMDEADAQGDHENGREGLDRRHETQLVGGEPVIAGRTSADGAWTLVHCVSQPSAKDTLGYPGWVRTAHLAGIASAPTEHLVESGVDQDAPNEDAHPLIEFARRHLGLRYLWGGLSAYGYDCSGVVHHGWRDLGVTVPRDAHDQFLAAAAIPLGEEEPGDLYFFVGTDGMARDAGARMTHVGIVTEPGAMIHASGTQGIGIVEETLAPERLARLAAVGRLG